MDIWVTDLTASTSVSPKFHAFHQPSGHDIVKTWKCKRCTSDWTSRIKAEFPMKFKQNIYFVKDVPLWHIAVYDRWQYVCVGQRLTETSGDSFYGEAVNKLSLVWMSTSVKLKSVGCRFPSLLSQWVATLAICPRSACATVRVQLKFCLQNHIFI